MADRAARAVHFLQALPVTGKKDKFEALQTVQFPFSSGHIDLCVTTTRASESSAR